MEWISNAGSFDISINGKNTSVSGHSYFEERFTDSGTYNFVLSNTSSSTGGTINVGDELDYGEIAKLHISLSLGPGSEDVDLSQLIIYLSDGAHVETVRYNISDTGADVHQPTGEYFSVSPIRIRDSTIFKASQPVLRTGDIMEVVVDIRRVFSAEDSSYEGLEPRTEVSFQVRPEAGALVVFDFTTPGAFFDNKYILLRY